MVFYTERDIFSQVSTSIIQEKMKSIGKAKISNNFELGMATRAIIRELLLEYVLIWNRIMKSFFSAEAFKIFRVNTGQFSNQMKKMTNFLRFHCGRTLCFKWII